MIDILHDPIAYALSLAAILITILLTLLVRSRRAISYEVLSTTQLLTAHEEMEGRLLVVFDDQSVKDISIVLCQIFNSGNQAIAGREFVRPLSIYIEGRGRLLSAEVTETVPAQLTAEVAVSENEAVLKPTLLNAGDVVTVKMILTEFDGSLVLGGRVVGVSDYASAAIYGFKAELVRALWAASILLGGLVGVELFLVLAVLVGPSINEWPGAASAALFVVFIVPGGILGSRMFDRGVRGPRARSREYVRILKEREARSRNR